MLDGLGVSGETGGRIRSSFVFFRLTFTEDTLDQWNVWRDGVMRARRGLGLVQNFAVRSVGLGCVLAFLITWSFGQECDFSKNDCALLPAPTNYSDPDYVWFNRCINEANAARARCTKGIRERYEESYRATCALQPWTEADALGCRTEIYDPCFADGLLPLFDKALDWFKRVQVPKLQKANRADLIRQFSELSIHDPKAFAGYFFPHDVADVQSRCEAKAKQVCDARKAEREKAKADIVLGLMVSFKAESQTCCENPCLVPPYRRYEKMGGDDVEGL